MSASSQSPDPLKPRGMNKTRGPNARTDGWVGGRADTWSGHYRDNPASRGEADTRRLSKDKRYSSKIAEKLRQTDDSLVNDSELKETCLTATPLSPGIGVEVEGIDLAKPTPEQISQVWRLFLSHKVVFFRDQSHISREEHIAFGKCFADIGLAFGRQQALSRNNSPKEFPEILRLYSTEANPFAASNWHSDVTWSNKPPLGSVLLSRKSPPVGGDTVFVDAYALWDSLNPDLKEFLEGRTANHGRGGRDEVSHPICRTHPETGRQALYINPTFTNTIDGMDPADSSRLLANLYAKMYATPEHACRFKWRDGSVAMWDNRSCQHYAVADFWPHDRLMERVTLVDRTEELELPYYEDSRGKRHYSVALASQESIDTPLEYA